MQDAIIKATQAQALLLKAQAGYENAWTYLIWSIIGCIVLFALVYSIFGVAALWCVVKSKSAITTPLKAGNPEPASLKERIAEIGRDREDATARRNTNL